VNLVAIDFANYNKLGSPASAFPRFRILLMLGLPDSAKQVALQKWDSLQSDGAISGEATKTKKWLDGLLTIPFGKYVQPPISLQKCLSEDPCKEGESYQWNNMN
jgi:hypothetical protein